LGSLLTAFVISFTVAGSVALGVTAAYASVLILLHAFAQNTPKLQPQRPVALAAKAGGD